MDRPYNSFRGQCECGWLCPDLFGLNISSRDTAEWPDEALGLFTADSCWLLAEAIKARDLKTADLPRRMRVTLERTKCSAALST